MAVRIRLAKIARMTPTPLALPRLKRVPPAVWIVLAWGVSVGYPALTVAGRPPAGSWDWSVITAGSLLACAAAVLLRRFPVAATGLLLAAATGVAGGWRAGVQLPPSALLAVDVALCAVTAGQPRRSSRAALALVVGVLLLHLGLVQDNALGLSTETWNGAPLPGTVLRLGRYEVTSSAPHLGISDQGLLVAVIAWLVGRSIRQSREHAEALGAELAARAVTAERLRIAREMHDTVAHSIGVVALQAGAAALVIDSKPERAKAALGEIEAAGRETLAGLRRMLGALRAADGPQPGVQPGVEPEPGAPGLADLDRLAATTTAAGVRVDVRWAGEPRRLPPDVDLAAFRIIQEAVANVVRHAGARSCEVSIDCRDAEQVAVEITDRGRGRSAAPGGGHGLVGLRERVALLHGEFQAGPRGGGFRVAARLPVAGGVR